MISQHRLSIGLALAFTTISLGTAAAGSISIVNSDFSTVPDPAPTYYYNPNGYFDEAAIPGWTAADTSAGAAGQWFPNNTVFVGATAEVPAAYFNGTTISQTVGATVSTGVLYTLTVSIGWRYGYSYNAGADLLVNGVQYLATPDTTPAAGYFTDYTATYTGLAGDAGDAVAIELTAPAGYEGTCDATSLTDTPAGSPPPSTPERGSLLLTGTGLTSILLPVRRRLSSSRP